MPVGWCGQTVKAAARLLGGALTDWSSVGYALLGTSHGLAGAPNKFRWMVLGIADKPV